mgnify:CR=1 FL=1
MLVHKSTNLLQITQIKVIMRQDVPKSLIKSKYRREMWQNSKRIIKSIAKVLPIMEVYLLGSFVTPKRRPADVDFIILLKIKEKNKKSNWSVDLVIAPDNQNGDLIVKDAAKWMKQKYGSYQSAVIKLR